MFSHIQPLMLDMFSFINIFMGFTILHYSSMKKKIILAAFLTISLSIFSQTYKRQFFEIDCHRSYTSHIIEVNRSNNTAIMNVRNDDLYTYWYISDVSAFKSALLRVKSSYAAFINDGASNFKEVKKTLPISFPLIEVSWCFPNQSLRTRKNLTITTTLISNFGCFFAPKGSSSGWGKFAQIMIWDYDSGKGINSGINLDIEALNSLLEAL